MRILLPLIAVITAVWLAAPASSHAVGYYNPAKESYRASDLTARGEIPDTLNQLKEALYFTPIVNALDRIAVEVKAILSQFGVRSPGDRYERRMTVKSDIKRRIPKPYRRSKKR